MTTDRCAHDSELVRFVRISIAPAAAFGSSFSMSLQFVLLTPFAVSLGISRTGASLIWLVGPLTGLLVQPAVGWLSDMYHRVHATRLPIVCVASVTLVVAHLGIAFSKPAADFMSVSPIILLVASFLVFDAANNAIVVTMRAMLADRFGKEHRTFAFSVLQFWTSLGQIAGYCVAQLQWGRLETNLYMSFLVSAVMVAFSTVLSALSVYEKRACRMRFHGRSTGSGFKLNKFFLEPCLRVIVVGSFLTWFGWFAQQIYQSDWVSTDVLGLGDPAKGVKLSALGLLIGSGLSCLTGLLLPVFLTYTGNDSATLFRIWALSSIVQGCVLVSAPLVSSLLGALVWEASVGPMFAIALTVPFMLVASGCDHGSSGRIMALVNVAVCLPQLVVILLGSILTMLTPNAYLVLFVTGGIMCATAAKLLWVPSSTDLPPWSQSPALSMSLSNSGLYSSIRDNVLFEEAPSPVFRIRGLTEPLLAPKSDWLEEPLFE